MSSCSVCHDAYHPERPRKVGRRCPIYIPVSDQALLTGAAQRCPTCFLASRAFTALESRSERKLSSHKIISNRWLASPSFVVTSGRYQLSIAELKDGEKGPRREGSDTHAEVARRLRHNCIEEHQGCSQLSRRRPHWLPTRLVYVGKESPLPRLIETAEDGLAHRRPEYVALSHCWGQYQIIKTERASYNMRKAGMAWNDLSKTFRDAITVTRDLDIDYIWIDSLCIIQDDPSDWAAEAATMFDVYSSAYLTIAATSAPSGEVGFLPTQGALPDSQFTKLFDESVDGVPFSVYYRRPMEHTPIYRRHGI